MVRFVITYGDELASSRKVIVVIEDDEAVRALVSRALASSYDVQVAADGASGLALLQRIPDVALIICDVMMPGIDGFTVARKAKSTPALRQVPIVFLTARTGPADVIQGIQAGAKHYITKPFKVDQLLEKVRKAIDG